MTLLRWEGFDHYAVAAGTELTRKWAVVGNSSNIALATGRFGGQAANLGNSTYVAEAVSNLSTFIQGFGFKIPSFSNDCPIAFAFDSVGTLQVELRIDTSGRLRVTRNGTLVHGPSATGIITANTWCFIEWKVTIHNSAGSVEVRVNGVSVLTGSSLDTQNTANAYATHVGWGTTVAGLGVAMPYDDLYLCDTAGSAPTNDFIGDCRVETIYPNGNGNSSQLDGSDGNQTDNYLLVDETTDQDDDTTYVQSADANDKDTYAFGNLSIASGTVLGVAVNVTARKDDVGTKEIAPVARSGGSDYDGSTAALTTAYETKRHQYLVNPNTGSLWTIAEVNSAEFGVKVIT